ncbi:MAG: UbiA prenyltransferase family protein, partial [Thaumarchaeota archaeon]|nr:UbiA prenyltransferase family protein [Nitrososphaerota archaeon]
GDMEDIEGDASAGIRSLPVILGPKRTAEVLLGTIVGVAIMISFLHSGLGFNPWLTLPVGLYACWLGIRYLWRLLQSPSSIADCLMARKKLRAVYMLIQFALVLGAFNL